MASFVDSRMEMENNLHEFYYSLLMNVKQYDSIMVAMDKLFKLADFVPVKYTYKTNSTANIFMKEIFRLHGFPKAIISDKDAKFNLNFWKIIFAYFDT